MVRFNNFIFDLDGTLVDSTAGIQAAFEYAWKSVYPENPIPDIRQSIGPPIDKIFLSLVGTASTNEIFYFVSSFREAYDQWGWKLTALYDDVVAFLELLRHNGCQCYGVTNKPSQPTKKILNALGIADKFKIFLSPDSHLPPFRNKAEAIQNLMIEYQLDNANTVLIGDSPEDAEAAFIIEIAFIYRQSDKNKEVQLDSPISYCCTNLNECKSMIGGINGCTLITRNDF